MTYEEARKYLESIEKKGNRLGLDSMRCLLQELGNPQDHLRFVHIAGTNGKGSVMTYLEQMLLHAGHRTGRYLSPVLTAYEEKIQCAGEWISRDEVAHYTAVIRDAIERLAGKAQPLPTIFEVETAMAFLFFADHHCDPILLECGMGGETDATNVVKNTLAAVFSSISLDHMEFLGNTIGEIAAVKAGIIKPGCLAVSDDQPAPAKEAISAKALEQNCPVVFLRGSDIANIRYGLTEQSFDLIIPAPFDDIPAHFKDHPEAQLRDIRLHLPGVHQIHNCALAVLTALALRQKGLRIEEQDIYEGAASARWPGRFEILCKKPLVIADGAHNPDAAANLRKSIDLYFPDRRIYYIFGVFSDKEYDKIIKIMSGRAEKIFAIETENNPRALPAEKLAQRLRELDARPQIICAGHVRRALDLALAEAGPDDVILLFGSLSWLGQARSCFDAGAPDKTGSAPDKTGSA